MKTTTIEDQAIERLSASKMKAADERRRAGKAAGAKFVLHQAEVVDIERLQRWHDRLGTNADAIMDQLSFHHLAAVMAEEDGTEGDIEANLREDHGDDIDTEAWLAGFIDGALAKYHELEPKLK